MFSVNDFIYPRAGSAMADLGLCKVIKVGDHLVHIQSVHRREEQDAAQMDEWLHHFEKVRAHEIKTWCLQFQAVLDGDKTFEVRFDDRGYCVGDHLVLREWNHHDKTYTGRVVTARIPYLLTHEDSTFGASVKPGYVVMSLSITEPDNAQ